MDEEPRSLEDDPQKPLELFPIEPSISDRGDFDPASPPPATPHGFQRLRLSLQDIPVYKRPDFKVHWDQFVELMLASDGRIRPTGFSVVESIAERVATRIDELVKRKKEQEKLVKALESGNVTMQGVKPHPQRIAWELENAKEEHSALEEDLHWLRNRYLAARKLLSRYIFQAKRPVEWNKLAPREQQQIIADTRGRRSTIDKHPEDIRDTLETILDFTKRREADDRTPFFKLEDAVKKRLPGVGSRSGAQSAIKRAIRVLRDECSISLPDEPVTNVGYHIKNRDLIKEGCRVFVRDFMKNGS